MKVSARNRKRRTSRTAKLRHDDLQGRLVTTD
jgi:hypothetical protein